MSIVPPAKLSAQRTTFDPSVSVSAYQEYVALTEAAEGSEYVLRFGLELPVERQLRKGRLSFLYEPGYQQYEDTGALDNTSHRLSLSLDLQPRRLSSFSLKTTYSKSFLQADARSQDEADFFLTQRLDRERVVLDLQYADRLAGQWFWLGRAGYAVADYSPIAGLEPQGEETAVEDRVAVSGAFRLARRISSRTLVGLQYARSRYDLDLSGEETNDLLSLTVGSDLSRNATLEFSLGGFRTRDDGALGELEAAGDREGIQGSLALTRELRRLLLTVFARAEPSAGGARVGTSTNSVLGFALASKETRVVSWDAALRLGRRKATDRDREDIDSVTLRLGTEYRLARLLALRLVVNYVDQSGEAEELSFLSEGGISLVWYPLAGSRISGRSQGD
jgi:hypothetical protein